MPPPDFRQHRTVTAVFGGVCVATGKRYGKGTPLIRTPKGYAIAPSTLTGNIPPEILADVKETNICSGNEGKPNL